MMSGLILLKMPVAGTVRSFAVTPPVHSNIFKIQNPPVVQAFLGFTSWRQRLWQVLCMTPSPIQSPKENKLKLWPKIYVLQCTLYKRRNVHLRFFTKYI